VCCPHRHLLERIGVYAYNTQQRVDDFYAAIERQFSEETGFPRESPEVREFMATARENLGWPRVAVGPFTVFVDNTGSKFSVHETQTLYPLVRLESHEQSKRLHLLSSREKDWLLPRFMATFTYSEDSIYKVGVFAVQGKEGTPERWYFDTKGTGAFDVMYAFENGMPTKYTLAERSWERADEFQFREAFITDLAAHLKDVRAINAFLDETRANEDSQQVDPGSANGNQDVDVEQLMPPEPENETN